MNTFRQEPRNQEAPGGAEVGRPGGRLEEGGKGRGWREGGA
jgi:hypothetical protein